MFLSSLRSGAILLAITLSQGAFSNTPPTDTMANFIIENMKASGELTRLSDCSGLDKTKIISGIKHSVKACAQYIESDDDSMENCTKKEMATYTGLSEKELDACDEHSEDNDLFAENTQQEAILEEIEHVYADIGDNQPTPEQQAKLEMLQKAMLEASLGEMKQVIDATSAASQKTLDEITLPIYPNSTVMMHVQNPSEFFGENKDKKGALPAATFQSPDSLKTVTAFYKKSLPHFKSKKLKDGSIVFMENMPKDFNLLDHYNEYLQHPHIYIVPVEKNSALKPSSKTTIEISYQPK